MQESIKLVNGNTLEIFQDMSPESPREWCNVSELICFHKRYELGDKHTINHDNYTGWDAMEEENTTDKDIVLPLYLYDHSGITIATKPFSCSFDSGQVGFAVVRESTIKIEFNGDRNKALKSLKAEIELYAQYLRGETYGYILNDSEGEEIDSCWGFYGYDPKTNGIFDQAGIKEEEIL